ncbi:MAG: Nif3-like dinuclear metal center hexameric protein [Puniceicoccales bacterium]|jgi:dinuclear metal center YbgI/SA1388 family protein|nr:Nif3-like dinuclear metal center hexameric protein [Puniceicoccales bacterium]
MVSLFEIINFCDNFLKVTKIKDYEQAHNGLQCENNGTVTKIGAAVDANLLTMERAVEEKVDLLLAHHGMLWGKSIPIVGTIYKKYKILMENNLAVYGVHLPLDMHGEIGNNVSIVRALELQQIGQMLVDRAYDFEIPVASAEYDRSTLEAKLFALFPDVKCMGFGTKNPKMIAICSGGGGSQVADMIQLGADTVITGEGPRHLFDMAYESKINLYICGHYATETFGIKNLMKLVANKFSLQSTFIEEKCEL